MEEGEGSSELGVRGATTGCRRASECSCAARADAGVDDSSVAGTVEGGGGGRGSSSGSNDEITATSVAGGEIGSRDADEGVRGRVPRIDSAGCSIDNKVGGNHQVINCNEGRGGIGHIKLVHQPMC